MSKIVQLDFISDFICPWCYLGISRIERIRKELEQEISLDIRIKPYLLYPSIPKGGVHKSHFAKKTRPGMGQQLKAEALAENIEINYRKIENIPNSFEAHRLTMLVRDPSLKYRLCLQIFHDYFENGQDIEEEGYLAETAKLTGVDKNTIGLFLDPVKGYTEVEAALDESKAEFITVVPSIRFAERLLMPGLQSSDVWLRYIRKAASMST